MKKIAKIIAVLFAASMIMSCDDPTQVELPVKKTAQEIINSADKVADLTGIEISQKSNLEISKAITVTGGTVQCDMNSSKIIVKASGTTIKNLKNVAELVIDEAVGNGDVTVSGCEIAKLTVKGGGANSIHIENVKVAAVSVAKEGVRLVLEGKSSVTAIEIKVPCVLDSTSNESTIKNLKVEASVKSIEIKGQTQVEKIVATSADFKVMISSNDVKVTAAVVKTEDGKTSAVKVEAAADVTVEEIEEISADELDELLEEIMSDLEDDESNEADASDEEDEPNEGDDTSEDTDKKDETVKDSEETKDPAEDDEKEDETIKDPEETKDPAEDDEKEDETVKNPEETKEPEEEVKNPEKDDSGKDQKDPEEPPVTGKTKIEISILSQSDISVTEVKSSTGITLIASDGYDSYEWSSLGKILRREKSLELLNKNYPNGTYVFDLLAVKNGEYYSASVTVTFKD